MGRRFKKKAIDQLLEEEYLREANCIADAAFSETQSSGDRFTQEEINASYAKLVEKLKAEGAYQEEALGKTVQNDQNNSVTEKCTRQHPQCVETSTANMEWLQGKHKLVKRAGFMMVCILSILNVSLTADRTVRSLQS